MGGEGLRWQRACVTVSVAASGAPSLGLSPSALGEELERAFSVWTEAECPEGGQPAFEVIVGQATDCGTIQFNECGPNANAWLFPATWPYPTTGGDLGLTTPTFDLGTGELVDVDVEINIGELASRGVPLPGVLAHEAGHFLGLDHSPLADALMFERYSATAMPALTPDDVAGICALYPPAGAQGACDAAPLNGFAAECVTDRCADDGEAPKGTDGGCSVVAGLTRTHAWGLVMVIVALGLARRQRAGRTDWR